MRHQRAGGNSFQEALALELKILKEVHEPDQQSGEGSSRHKEQNVSRYGELGGKEGQLLPLGLYDATFGNPSKKYIISAEATCEI